MKDAAILGALVVCLVGVSYGVFHHARFFKAKGQSGFQVAPVHAMSESARTSYRAMLVGYGLFLMGIAMALVLSAIWGPSGT